MVHVERGKGMIDKEVAEQMIQVSRDLAEMLELAFQAFRRPTEESIKDLDKARGRVGQSSSELKKLLISKGSSKKNGKEWAKPFLSMASSFDRMAYNIEGIVYQVWIMLQKDVPFSDRAIKEVNTVFQEAMDLLEDLPDLILTQNKSLAQHIGEKVRSVFKIANAYSEEHERRLIEGVCIPKSSPIYLGILESLDGVIAHTLEVSGKIASLSSKP